MLNQALLRLCARFVFAAVVLLPIAQASAQNFTYTTLLEASDTTQPVGVTPLFDQTGFAGDGFTTQTIEFGGLFRPTDIFDVRSGQTATSILPSGPVAPSNGDPFATIINPQGNGVATSFAGGAVDTNGNISARGAYLSTSPGTALETVALVGQSFPGGGTISGVGTPVLTDDEIALVVETDRDLPTERTALVTRSIAGGSFTTLVDTSTPVPNQATGDFIDVSFGPGGYDGVNAAFIGTFETSGFFSEGQGIYTVAEGAAPVLRLAGDTVLPGLGDRYSLNIPSIAGDKVYFQASRFGNIGIFGVGPSGIEAIVNTSTPLPHDASATFTRFGAAIDASPDGRVVFQGVGSDDSFGVYLYEDGQIVPVLTSLDVRDGLPVATVNVWWQGLRGDDILLEVVLVDGMTPVAQVVLATIQPDSPVGDYNGDGFVSAADYTQWRDGASPDDSIAGFNAWANNFGAGPPATIEAAAVPEPTAIVLLLATTLSLVATRSSRP